MGIEIIEYPPEAQEILGQLFDLMDYIEDENSLPDSAIRHPASSRRQALLEKLDELRLMIADDELNGAIQKLTNDILDKMNGCPPQADANDWILDCSQQSTLQIMLQDLITSLEALMWSTLP
jgi:hypothetical protein